MTERAHESDSELSEVDRLLLACVEAAASEQETVLDSLCRAHPELAEDLRLRWGLLGQVGFLAGGPDRESAAPERIGGFRIVRRLGGGGMGVVYLAEQEDLGREVALKVLRPEFAASDRARERFRREGVTLSKLEHPGICPVYEVGEVEGMPYLAMRYLEGHTLAELVEAAQRQALSGSVWLAGSSDGETPSEGTGERARMGGILRVFEKIARAVHAAHEEGLVHRDLKPANLVIGGDGEPVVLDFGLAWDEAGDVGLTHSGDVLGTPAYLAPEQVEGRRRADRRTDVYALGVTLYECLTLNRPFQGSNREALYRQILGGEFADARTRNRHVARDLAVVVAKAMDRSPERRYGNALGLAEDLRRVRAREPIAARPAGLVLRSWRWTQRNPVLAAFLLFLLVGLGWTAAMLSRVSNSLRQTQAMAVSNLAFKVAEREPKAGLWLAVRAWERDDREETRSQLYAGLAQSHEARRLGGHTGAVNTVRFSSDGRRLVSSSDDGKALVWDLEDTASPVELKHEGPVYDAVFVKDEEHILTASWDGTARVWELTAVGAHELARFGELEGVETWGVRVAPNRRTALLQRTDGPLVVDLERMQVRHTLEHRGRIWNACYSPDGEMVATAVGYGRWDPPADARLTARVWRVADGTLVGPEMEHSDSILTVCFAPDGRLLTGSRDGTARLWDPRKGTPAGESIQHGGSVWCSAVIDARPQPIVALGGTGSSLRLWKIADRRPTLLREQAGLGMAISVEPDPHGTGFLAAFLDGTARLFDFEGNQRRVFRGHSGNLFHASYSPDRRQVATAGWDGTVRLWRLEDSELAPFGVHLEPRFVDVTSDGTVALAKQGQVTLIPSSRAPEVSVPIDLALGLYNHLARPRFSPSGVRFVAAAKDHVVRIFARDGEQECEFALEEECRDSRGHFIAAFAGEDRVLIVTESGYVSLRDLSGRRAGIATRLTTIGRIHALDLDIDRRRFALGGSEGAALFGFDGAQIGRVLGQHTDVIVDLAFSPDGRTLATASHDRTARLSFLDDSIPKTIVLGPHERNVTSVAFAPDGKRLVTGSADGKARIWSVVDGSLWASIDTGAASVFRACWTLDGNWILTSLKEEGVRRWPASTENLLRLSRARSAPATDNGTEVEGYRARLRRVFLEIK